MPSADCFSGKKTQGSELRQAFPFQCGPFETREVAAFLPAPLGLGCCALLATRSMRLKALTAECAEARKGRGENLDPSPLCRGIPYGSRGRKLRLSL